jgi:squalene synthase HpnC
MEGAVSGVAMTNAAATLDTPSGKNKDTENFPVGSFLLAEELRPHVFAYYAFARGSDDIADHTLLPPDEKLRRLTRYEEELKTGEGTDVPAAAPLRASLKETGITPQHALDLIHAFKQDAVKRRYRNWDELLDYCRYSASAVGRYMLALHGIGEAAWPGADALCSALQVINHLQDCADDYRELDRVYLPEDDFIAAEANPAMLAAVKITPPLRKVLDMQLARLKPMLKESRGLKRHIPDTRLRMEVCVIQELAEALVKRLERRDPLSQNTKLSKLSVLWAAFTGCIKAFV